MSSRRTGVLPPAASTQDESVDPKDVMNKMADHAAGKHAAHRQKVLEKARKVAEAFDRELKELLKAQEQELAALYDEYRIKKARTDESLGQALVELQGSFAAVKRPLRDTSSSVTQRRRKVEDGLKEAYEAFETAHQEETKRARLSHE